MIAPIASANTPVTETKTKMVTNSVQTDVTSRSYKKEQPEAVPPIICRYYLCGTCRYGTNCRFSHDLRTVSQLASTMSGFEMITCPEIGMEEPMPSYSRKNNWADAPVFVPNSVQAIPLVPMASANFDANIKQPLDKPWTDGDDACLTYKPGSVKVVCPFKGPCPHGEACYYAMHFDLCKMCDEYCLHPNDMEQRRQHNHDCLKQHEQAMELSFAIARSKDKTCGICFDIVMEKLGREKRFGILPNCTHIFCLECIRKWRQSKQFEHKISRSCPECRIASDFVCPSSFWVETKEEKDKLLTDYRNALGIKDCKYFKKGEGKCPFGNKCFYKHALPNGDLVDVGLPKRTHRRYPDAFMDLLDNYLWEYYHWMDLLDDSDDSDWSHDM